MKLSSSAKIKIVIVITVLLLVWTFFSQRLLVLGTWAVKHDYDYFNDYSEYDSQEEYAEDNNITFGLFTSFSFESDGKKESGNYYIKGDTIVTLFEQDGETIANETRFKATEFTFYEFSSWSDYYYDLREEDSSELGYERVGFPVVYIFRIFIIIIALAVIFRIRRNNDDRKDGDYPSSSYDRLDRHKKRTGLYSTMPPSVDDMTYYRPPVSTPPMPSATDYGIPSGYYTPTDYGAGAIDINQPSAPSDAYKQTDNN